jgi:ABC-2 type transport system permease protein
MGMLFEVFLHTLQELRQSMLGWSLGLLVYGLFIALLYPLVALQPVPEFLHAFAMLVGVENAVTTPEGWFQAAGFALILPLALCSLTVWAGSRLIVVDEQNGSLEMLLSYPLSRWRLIFEKFMALVAGVFLLCAALWLVLASVTFAFGLMISSTYLAAACLGLALLTLVFAGLAFYIASYTGRAGYARLLTWGVLLVTYLFGAVWLHGIGFLRWFSPFYYASLPSGEGNPWLHVIVLLALIGVSVNAAYRGFEQRDLAV